jgi:hypothetical protein
MNIDDPAGFADLQDEGVRGEERLGTGVQRPDAAASTWSSSSAAITLSWDFERWVIPGACHA